jgi:hypothetical protein
MNSEVVKDFLATFPDAKLTDVSEDNDAWFYWYAFKSKRNAG